MFLSKSKQQKDIQRDPILEREEEYRKGVAVVKDLIAPAAFKVSPSYLEIGETCAKTIFVMAFPRFLSANWFSPVINVDFPINISIFIHPVDTNKILKSLLKTTTQIQSRMELEAQSGKVRNPMLESAMQNTEELRTKLQEGTERFFRVGIYITIFGEDIKELNKVQHSLQSSLEAQMIYVKPASFRMEQGLASTVPLAEDRLDVANNLNTSPLSTLFPFVSAELSSNKGVLYGINRHNNSLILFDRFEMENANMVVFAKSGAGKSYAVKLEVLRSLMMGTNVIIIDPENEYKHLSDTVGGSFIKISLNSKFHLNPFDLPRIGEEAEFADALRNNVANLVGLLRIMLGNITPEENSILDAAIRETYSIRDITESTNFRILTPDKFPTMSDLYDVLKNMEGAGSLATRLERYTEGIFSGFLNNHTNIKMNNSLVVFNIRDLEDELRPIAMYTVLQFIWNEMRAERKKRMVVVDEAWVMMQHEDAASFLFGIAKRCRKYYTGLTTITQDVNDFMNSKYGKPIVTNASIQFLLKQSTAAIDIVQETFFLTDQEKFLLLESNVGEGIFFAGNKHAAIKVIASYSEDQIITSDPRQLLEIEEAKRELE
ncbi:MAG: ATP-binding protein [Candidatus Moranbacteria bacterium]|jgi:type IV secretory pathway VirB4 component|nr:ATP-binding protein [Candidatus Moranbacteria bacterium]MDD5652250.1 ATP-binding protein [Candidatus Moranbacteria bacterium]MDX9856047.1 ATP-binding protein [Candidatus Moranbacteria bacterium]